MIWAIFTSLASLASIIGLAFQLYQHKEKPLTYALLIVALLSSIVSAVLWVESQSLDLENKKLKAARYQAEMLYTNWPDPDDFDYVSGGEFRGIVLSGMAFLETNRELFPETYETTKHLMFTELKASTDDESNYVTKRIKLQEAAEAMVLTIKTIRMPPSS
ncbi:MULTISPECIES: hypothetical protein [Vibrio]|uniref:hypothetical protein n=3 Tax=Vibrionaceae TaxID=641 RepID=UPI000C8231F8|nr:hypothetical protein [Vibrio splendidus]PMG52504.1 hypothetical protein BCU89_20240 [Vibrio splendidus]